jgi:hypothetical protein
MTDKPKTLLGALALALPTIEAAKKNAANPHFKSKYADIGAVIDAIRPIADHGLWFRQVSHDSENGVCVETFYIHDSGELSAGRVFVPASKRDAQGFGSAQTYARRYGLQLAFGLSTEDDDGNAASKAPPKQEPALITDEQRTELMAYLEHGPVPVSAFLDRAQIKDLRELPAAKLNGAWKWLKDQEAAIKAAEPKPSLADELGDDIPY